MLRGSDQEKAPLTAAELIRKRKHVKGKKRNHAVAEQETVMIPSMAADLDDEIRRLEAELQEMSSSSDVDVDDDDEDSSSSAAISSCADGEEKNSTHATEDAILALSSVKDERIEPLPAAALPAPVGAKHTKRKSGSGEDTENGNCNAKRNKKTPPPDSSSMVSAGLKAAVQEVLRGYQPRSAEHLPFYCRCCAKQYDDMAAFQQHKTTDFHRAAVELERKASYCKLCRKQLTSPAQLQEHLQSKPHRERLKTLQSRQVPQQQKRKQQPQQYQQHRQKR